MRKVIFISALIACFPLWLSGQELFNDTTKSTYYWRITERTGEIIEGKPDTLLTDFPNRTHVEGQSVAMAYLGNLGLPMESRVFFERPDPSNFMFSDPYFNYMKTPGKHNFMRTKIPYSNLTYQSGGSRQSKEERLMGGLSVNFGKHINVGVDVDYLYARGFYTAQSAKHTDWDFYGSYISDKHVLHAFIAPSSYTNAENGGIIDDRYITDPASIGYPKVQPRDIPVTFEDPSGGAILWNRVKGTRYYLNYHYNLGFEKETEAVDKEGNPISEFVPVSSIIYTFDFTDRKRSFNTSDSTTLDSLYRRVDYFGNDRILNDSTSYWSLKNTIGLSLREGFSKWAKFDLTAFLTQDINNYTLMSKDTTKLDEYRQYNTYIGGEIAKRTGKILRYNAQGDICVVAPGTAGYNLGAFKVTGNIETRIPIFKDTASVTITGSIKNLAQTFYQTNFHGKYFWWDNNKFNKIQKAYIGGTINIPHTKTNFNLGVENVNDYIYFDSTGHPTQHSENIQILAASLKQNFKLGGLHWDNQLIYQTSSNQEIIPLPELCVYSSLYFQFLVSKVLTVQLGTNVHYFTKYYAPTYEPATQQFKLQNTKDTKNAAEVGNYPLVNAFVNCHLKYTRFFIEFYNLSSSFVPSPAYFSMPHYPVNPQLFRFGLSWDFHN